MWPGEVGAAGLGVRFPLTRPAATGRYAKLCIATLSCPSDFSKAARQPSLGSTRCASTKPPLAASGIGREATSVGVPRSGRFDAAPAARPICVFLAVATIDCRVGLGVERCFAEVSF